MCQHEFAKREQCLSEKSFPFPFSNYVYEYCSRNGMIDPKDGQIYRLMISLIGKRICSIIDFYLFILTQQEKHNSNRDMLPPTPCHPLIVGRRVFDDYCRFQLYQNIVDGLFFSGWESLENLKNIFKRRSKTKKMAFDCYWSIKEAGLNRAQRAHQSILRSAQYGLFLRWAVSYAGPESDSSWLIKIVIRLTELFRSNCQRGTAVWTSNNWY